MSNYDPKLADHLIDKYRELILIRYQYDEMHARQLLDPQLNKEIIEVVREFFLESVYPTADVRRRLEESFYTLKSFLSKPSKIWRLLGNMAGAIFRFGRLFPAAIKAGIKALQSYMDAKDFEKSLLEASAGMNLKMPLSKEDFDRCLATIPRHKAEDFMKDVLALFRHMTNTALVEKTIEIMDSVIEKMKKYPHIYTTEDIDGILLGRGVLDHGARVFRNMAPNVKSLVLEAIEKNELWFLDEVYSKYTN